MDYSYGRPLHRNTAPDFSNVVNSVYHRADTQHLPSFIGVSVLGKHSAEGCWLRNSTTDFVRRRVPSTIWVDIKDHLPTRRGIDTVSSAPDVGFTMSTTLIAVGALLSYEEAIHENSPIISPSSCICLPLDPLMIWVSAAEPHASSSALK